MKKYLVLGSGFQGRVVALDILKFDEGSQVILGDINEENLKKGVELSKEYNVTSQKVDIFNTDEAAKIMSEVDVVINSLPHPWKFTKAFYEGCVKSGTKGITTDYSDWEKHYVFEERLKEAKSLVVPGLGIAPGFANICVGQLAEYFDQIEEAYIYVGGLPERKGVNPLDYMILYSVESVLDMYFTPPEIVEDGELKRVKTLENIIPFSIPGIGEFELMITDGLASLNKTVKEKGIKRMYEASIRYPGHYEKIKLFKDCGFFDEEPVNINGIEVSPREVTEAVLNKKFKKIWGERDFVYLLVKGKGLKNGKYIEKGYELMDYSDEEAGLTSMARTTAYPVTIASIMLAYEDINSYGIIEPERFFVGERFDKLVKELAKRNVIVNEKIDN